MFHVAESCSILTVLPVVTRILEQLRLHLGQVPTSYIFHHQLVDQCKLFMFCSHLKLHGDVSQTGHRAVTQGGPQGGITSEAGLVVDPMTPMSSS